MYNLASSFSRVADAEWVRSCESVRRFSPTVGTLGRWKALCEGGWSGAYPPDLPGLNGSVDQSEAPSSPSGTNDNDSGLAEETTRDLAPPRSDKPAPQYSSRNASEQGLASRAVTPGQSPVPPPQYFPSTPAGDQQSTDDHSLHGSTKEAEERKSIVDNEERKGHSTTLASLAAFPSPPTHYPLPPLPGNKVTASPVHTPTQETHSEISQGSHSSSGLAPFPRLTDSPAPDSVSTPPLTDDSRSPATPRTELFTPPPLTSHLPADTPVHDKNRQDSIIHGPQSASQAHVPYTPATRSTSSQSSATPHQEPPQSDRGPRALSESPINQTPSTPGPYRRGDYADDAEFGVRRSADQSRPRAAEPSLTRVVERSDTGKSNGSVVAALRDRYARPVSVNGGSVSDHAHALCRDPPLHLPGNFPGCLLACRVWRTDTNPHLAHPTLHGKRRVPLPRSGRGYLLITIRVCLNRRHPLASRLRIVPQHATSHLMRLHYGDSASRSWKNSSSVSGISSCV